MDAPATWPDVWMKSITLFQPYLPAFVGILVLWLLVRITDASVMGVIRGIITEFSQLFEGKRNLLTANALGGILLFVLTLYLFFGGLQHVILPESARTNDSMAHQAVYVVTTFLFGAYFILCLLVSRYRR